MGSISILLLIPTSDYLKSNINSVKLKALDLSTELIR